MNPLTCFNPTPLCAGTRFSPRGYLCASLAELLFWSGQTRQLQILLALSGGQL